MTDRKRGVTFSENVAADSTQTASYTIPEAATIERLTTRIYVGAELDLHLRPYIVRVGAEYEEPMLQFQGKDYIDGDSDHFEFDLGIDVYEGDTIAIEATNLDTTYAYDYRVNVDLDSMGGGNRLMDVLTGWF